MSLKLSHIFEYVNYRKFLRDYYMSYKKNGKAFSHRVMASKLGFSSPNFLKLVMDGERNLSLKSLGKISKGLKLNKRESEYFSYLVFFNQAKDPVEKNYYFGLITSIRSKINISTLNVDQFEYFGEWYIPVVRELIENEPHPINFKELSKIICNNVSPAKIKKAVSILLKLKMIKIDERGIYKQTNNLINTSNELDSFAIRKYHESVINIAQKAIYKVAPLDREFGSLTLRISENGFKKIKSRLQRLREELLQIANEDSNTSGIYHANFQFYPVAQSLENKDVN